MEKSNFEKRVLDRSFLRYTIGLIPRIFIHFKFSVIRNIARLKGASIGQSVLMPLSLALKANSNLSIGDNVLIDSKKIDLRIPIIIGNNVIIGSDVEIITCSHNIDSKEWDFKPYGLIIENFSWLATKALILPSCRKIGEGAVVGGGSVVVRNVEQMTVVSGNPAKFLKRRAEVHSNIVVESLQGGDLIRYLRVKREGRINAK